MGSHLQDIVVIYIYIYESRLWVAIFIESRLWVAIFKIYIYIYESRLWVAIFKILL